MRWGSLCLWGVVACGPTVQIDGSGSDGNTESMAVSSSTTEPPSTSSAGPSPATSSSTTLPGPEDSGPSSTGPVRPDVPPLDDCYDDQCPVGQWCGPAHNECREIEEAVACAGEPEHRVVEIEGVEGTPVAVRVVDVDGDLDDDVVVVWDAPTAATVVLQDGGLVPLPAQEFAVTSPRTADLGDLDEDGIVDLVMPTTTNLMWSRGVGDGTFEGLIDGMYLSDFAFTEIGVGPGGDGDDADEVVLFIPSESRLMILRNNANGQFGDPLETKLSVSTPGAFAAIDPGFSTLMAIVGSVGSVHTLVPDEETTELVETEQQDLTNAETDIVDLDVARSGGGVHTFGFVNLQGWTFGGYLAAPQGIATPSRMVIGNGLAGLDYALVTEEDRVLIVNDCYDTHDLGAAPVAADAGDLDADGRGDLAVAMSGVPLTFLLSGSP